ncbi:hypothetical protein [Lactobacillus apis]|uniref:hypothetical protein n=1 Tax=Lactobacillus apis TaxID=303541 RepID=UPI0024312BCE|nr:hypothetical protein [Lactobacillus apis]
MINSSALFGFLAFIIGVGIFLNGIMTKLSIEKAGSAYEISVPFYDKQSLVYIQQAISTDIDKTDQSLYHHRLAEDDMDDVQ